MKHVPVQPPEGINASHTNPLAEFAILLLGLVVILGGTFYALGWVSDAIATRMSPQLERALGARFGPASEPSAGLDRERALFAKMAANLPDRGIDLSLDVVCTKGVNALALPGGRVLVLEGLLAKVQSENELAFVLGHELAHFVHRDHLRALGRGLLWMTLLTLAGVGGDPASTMAETVVARRFSQAQELAADRLALELLHATFGQVGGAADFFERRELADGGGWFDTHPGHDARVRHLRALAAERGWTVAPLTPYSVSPEICRGR